MARELINPAELHPAPGFTHVAIAEGVRVVHLAGQLGLAPDFSLVAEDLHGQTVGAMRNVGIALAAAGASWDDVVRRTIYTTEPTAYETISAAIDEVTGGAANPAQTIVGVTGLAVPGCLIEIECTAVLESPGRDMIKEGRHAPHVSRKRFFDIMASFPSGVAVVTTIDADGVPRGLTTSAVASVSATPPTLLVCVDLGSRTLLALRARRRFVVNFLGEGRSALALLFASKVEDKFAEVSWDETSTGLPLLAGDALAWAECATVHDFEVGDHAMLVARVEDGGVDHELDPPLMYYRRSWGVWSPVHEASEPDPVQIPAIEVSARDLRWQGAEM